jgi:hypothetical protein
MNANSYTITGSAIRVRNRFQGSNLVPFNYFTLDY